MEIIADRRRADAVGGLALAAPGRPAEGCGGPCGGLGCWRLVNGEQGAPRDRLGSVWGSRGHRRCPPSGPVARGTWVVSPTPLQVCVPSSVRTVGLSLCSGTCAWRCVNPVHLRWEG